MCDLQRDHPLFDKFLPIQLSDGIHEVRQSTSLVVRIIMGNQIINNSSVGNNNNQSGQTEKVIHLEVSNESLIYFIVMIHNYLS